MSYKQINSFTANSYTKGRQGADIRYIVIHHWGNTMGLKAENIVKNWFAASAPTSAHYVLQDGLVYYIVSEKDTAYHAGDWWYNTHSIGIECRPECTDGDLRTLAELIADIWKKHGKLEIIGHKNIVATSCPGAYYNKIPQIRKMAEAYYNGYKEGWVKNRTGWWYRNADGTWPEKCWKKIKGYWFYFNERGYALENQWLLYNKRWYYFKEGCYMATGWIKVKGKWYFLNENGAMVTGWKKYKDKWYYMIEKQGSMISNEFREVNGTLYKFNKDGSMATSGTYKVQADGKVVKI